MVAFPPPRCQTATKPLAVSNTIPGRELSAAPGLPQYMRMSAPLALFAYTVSTSTQMAAVWLAASQWSTLWGRRVVPFALVKRRLAPLAPAWLKTAASEDPKRTSSGYFATFSAMGVPAFVVLTVNSLTNDHS